MEKSCRKTRSHALDAPEGPLVDYLAQFESLLVEQGYPVSVWGWPLAEPVVLPPALDFG